MHQLVLMKRATEETADQNFPNVKFSTTDATHTPMTPPFLLLFAILGCFLSYLMTSSVGTQDNGPKPTRTGNFQLF